MNYLKRFDLDSVQAVDGRIVRTPDRSRVQTSSIRAIVLDMNFENVEVWWVMIDRIAFQY